MKEFGAQNAPIQHLSIKRQSRKCVFCSHNCRSL